MLFFTEGLLNPVQNYFKNISVLENLIKDKLMSRRRGSLQNQLAILLLVSLSMSKIMPIFFRNCKIEWEQNKANKKEFKVKSGISFQKL